MFANKEIYDIVCTMQGLPKKNKIKEILSWGQKLLYIYTHIYIYIMKYVIFKSINALKYLEVSILHKLTIFLREYIPPFFF